VLKKTTKMFKKHTRHIPHVSIP